jgi:predicted nuclease of predicted toxin-antitoxin system
MKLLFDENLSPKLPNRLSDLFPNSLHVRDVGMKATSDPIVWDYAKAIKQIFKTHSFKLPTIKF